MLNLVDFKLFEFQDEIVKGTESSISNHETY